MKTSIWFFWFSLAAGVCTAAIPYPGNDCDSGVTRARGLIDPYTGNIAFSTRDLVVAGAVGKRGLSWSRCATSRTSAKESLFGLGHNWAHNWQWELVEAGCDSQGRAVLSARLPGGWVHRFTETSPGEWWPEPGAGFRMTSHDDVFVIEHLDGGEVRFVSTRAERGIVFTLNELVDASGNVNQLTWVSGKLAQVSEPAGRWLKIEYAQLRAPTAADLPPFDVIAKVTSSDGQAVVYRYAFLLDADYPVLAGVDYPDGTSASYTYAAPRQGVRLLLTQAIDPRAESSVRGRVFRYRGEPEAALGQLAEVGVDGGSAILNALSPDTRGLRSYGFKQDNGSVIYRTYNPGGALAEEIDALGFIKKHEYDVDGRGFDIAFTDALGKITRYERDSNGQVVKQIAPDGTIRTWQRDAKGRVLSETNELGQTRVFTRDEQGRVTKLQQPDGRTTETAYNAFGQPIRRKAADGAMTRFEYDPRGLRTKLIDAVGFVTATTFDEHDRVSSTTDARGQTTRYERDTSGRVTKVIHADGSSTRTVYDSFGQIMKTVDATGSARTSVYDAFGRRTSMFDALGRETTHTEYAPLGTGPLYKPVRSTTPEGRTSTTTYDAKGQVVTRTVGAGTRLAATTRYAYDVRGKQVSITNPRGQTVQFFFDERGRRIKKMNALRMATICTYDAAGCKLSETDAKGNTTKWTYDAAGRELTKTDAKNQTITRAYDAGGRLATLTDPKGNAYRFEYDQLGRQTAMIYPDGSREAMTYDAAGNKLSYTNRAGITQSFTYDNRNREILSEWRDGSQQIFKQYDAAGRMTQEDNGVSKISYAFDEMGRLVSETQDLAPVVMGGATDPAPRTVSYAYTDDGQRETLTHPDESYVAYTYNARGQLKDILGEGVFPPIASYEYDSAGNATQMPRENATETAIEYDAGDRVTTISETSRRNPLSELEYTYDELNNRTSTSEILAIEGRGLAGAKIDTYHYDETYQVTGADYGQKVNQNGQLVALPEQSERLTYDAVGNRITVDEDGKITRYSVNALNQYTQVGEFAPAYDRNGNLAAMKECLYKYDALNRLAEVTDGLMTAKFYYDAKNRCVARSYNGATTLNYYDNWNLIEERDVKGSQVARYVHGRRTDELVVMVNRYGTFYPHRDVLGNVTMLTDAKGKLVERYSYSVAGKTSIFDASGKELPASTVGNRWMYTGREWLKEVGLYDYRNRVYSVELGRFIQTDPIRFTAGDVNIYRYVSNSYISRTDSTGLAENLNLFPSNESIYNSANAGPLDSSVYTVGAHGNSSGIYDSNGGFVSPQNLATMIQADPNYREGMPVRLDSCEVGNGTYPAQLKDILNAQVAAPDKYVWYFPDGSTTVSGAINDDINQGIDTNNQGVYIDNNYTWWDSVGDWVESAWDWFTSLFE